MGDDSNKEVVNTAMQKLKNIASELSKKLSQSLKIEINTNPRQDSVKINFTQINL